MKASYHGNAKPFVQALYATANWDDVLPLLQELDAKGLNLSYSKVRPVRRGILRRACAVIAFLSAQSMEDSAFEEAILYAKSSNVPLVCVNLDHTPLSDSINRLLYASNVIFADRYETPALLAERIMTAESLANPTLTKAQTCATRRMALALITGAILIVFAAGLIIWQRIDAANQVRAASEQTEKSLADVAGLLSSGMTEEDLLLIHTLILAGDNMINPYELSHYSCWDAVVSEMQMDGETVWSIEGKQVPRGTATDISLIGRMSNLQELILINQSVADLSPLQSLKNLEYLQLVDCPVENIEAISGLSKLKVVILDRTNVNNLAPLQSCAALESFIGSIGQCVSIEGLGNPTLNNIELFDARQLTNLDALSACRALNNLTIYEAAKLTDISGLSGCVNLSNLLLDGAALVRSSSVFSNITSLQQVEIRYCGFTELNGLKQSRELQSLRLQDVLVRDFSWTSGMNHLTTVQAHGTHLNNFNFLRNLGVECMELHFSGDIYDYSGLAAIPKYSFMHVNPRNGNIAAVLPYIENATFLTLE
jgi:Leucine-rich repeat (LRR) protein